MTSQSKITVLGNEIELTLNCKNVDKNIVRILRDLHQIIRLYLLPSLHTDRANELLTKSRQFEGTPFRRSLMQTKPVKHLEHTVTLNEAIQIIWRSALIAQSTNINEYEINYLRFDKNIGEINQLGEQIESLTSTLEVLSKKYGKKNPKIVEGQKMLDKLIKYKEKVQDIWSQIRKQQKQQTENLFKNPYISLCRYNFEPREKELILNYLRNKIIDLDLELFKQSLLFILELSKTQCIFSLEDSYSCYKGDAQTLKTLVGPITYQSGKKDLACAKEEAKNEGLIFESDNFKVCHKCLDIIFFQQKGGFLCQSKQIKVDIANTPYAYQQFILHCNYSATLELYNKKKAKYLQNNPNADFIRYLHPYLKAKRDICGRFICKNCLESCLPQKKKEESHCTSGDVMEAQLKMQIS